MSRPVRLAYSQVGNGPNVLILHGLFGWKRNWAGIAKGLSQTHRVYALDMRNHGESEHTPQMTYSAMAEDIAAFITTQGLGPCPVIGHSMGGKAAMVLALTRADLVERLLVLDIAPVAYEHDYSDYVAAMKTVNLTQVSRRSDVEPTLARVAEDPGVLAFLMQNLTTDERGTYSWRVNLDALEHHMADILSFPEFAGAQAYAGTTLFLAGGNSDYIAPQHAGAIDRLFPRAQMDSIDGAGHWVHAEQPMATLNRFQSFLR